MEEVAQFLGHNDIKVTRKVYARYSPEYLRKAAGSLDLVQRTTKPKKPKR